MRHDIVNLQHRERRGIVAQQQGPRFARAEPHTLRPERNLDVVQVDGRHAIEQRELVYMPVPLANGGVRSAAAVAASVCGDSDGIAGEC